MGIMTRRQFPDCMHAIPELGTVDAGKGASSIALPSSLIISNGLTICDSRNFFFFLSNQILVCNHDRVSAGP